MELSEQGVLPEPHWRALGVLVHMCDPARGVPITYHDATIRVGTATVDALICEGHISVVGGLIQIHVQK